jgi:alpha-glucosidase
MDDWLWWRDGVIYQIYPRSFADSNGDGIGDLQGIIGRLDYLADLGVDGLWLSPINPSPDRDFGYDVADYYGIDPKFGSMTDFETLIAEAHKRGLHIILDLVLNHTSDQNAWFLQSRSSRDNPYRDWYLWRDGKAEGVAPNNWESIFGGKAWTFDEQTGQWYYHMFVKEQPDLNWRNPAVRSEMLHIFTYWLEKGVDGFRLDVFNEYFKDAQFRDNPPRLGLRGFDRQQHIYDVDQPEMMGVVQEIRSTMDQYPERYVVGETFMAGINRAVEFTGENRLNAAFDFTLLHTPWNAARFLQVIQRWDALNDDGHWPNIVMNNHDNVRSATRYGRGEDDERLKVAAGLLLTLRGTPFLYQGEEIGMRDIPLTRSDLRDPVGIRYFPFNKGRDGCRSPMQWDASEFAGFSNVQPWLKVHPNHVSRNVESQLSEGNSLLNFYRKLLHLRKENSTLRRGMFQPITYEPRRLLAYLRQDNKDTVLVALNFGRRRVKLVLGDTLLHRRWEVLLSSKGRQDPGIQDRSLQLAGEEVCILKGRT